VKATICHSGGLEVDPALASALISMVEILLLLDSVSAQVDSMMREREITAAEGLGSPIKRRWKVPKTPRKPKSRNKHPQYKGVTQRLLNNAGPPATLKLPGNKLSQHPYNKAGIQLERVMIPGEQARSGDKASGQYGDGKIQAGSIAVMKREQNTENHSASQGDAVHADLVIDICDPSSAQGQESAQ